MDNKKHEISTHPAIPHEINLKNRSELKISGVSEVITATSALITAKTSAGGLTIIGENLKILNLNNQDKSLEIQGIVNEIKYNQKKKKFLEKIFK